MPGACDEIIDDIEDLISSQDITPKERYSSRKNVNVRSKKREKDAEPVEKIILESVVPGNLYFLFLFILFLHFLSIERFIDKINTLLILSLHPQFVCLVG